MFVFESIIFIRNNEYNVCEQLYSLNNMIITVLFFKFGHSLSQVQNENFSCKATTCMFFSIGPSQNLCIPEITDPRTRLSWHRM